MQFKIKLFIFLLFTVFLNYVNVGFGQDSNKQIEYFNNQIHANKQKIEKLENRKAKYSKAINDVNKQQATLKNQLAILDNRVESVKLEIETTKSRIDRANLEISKINFEINEKNKNITKEKNHISDILNLIYKQDKTDTLEILLLNDTLSDFLNKLKYLKDVNNEMGDSVEELKNYKKNLEKDKILLNANNKKLDTLKKDLVNQIKGLEYEKEKKKFILEQTNNSEKKYQILLKDAKSEQEIASRDIINLEESIRNELKKIKKDKIQFNDNGLIWPVPSHYITTYFHDPTYPFRYIFEHPAIDIRASQATEIKAAASGYVARVRWDTSSRYAYVMLIHGDGLATVYGHISKPLVKEDDYVVQGQSIALSGGMPGTSGSGRLTTGPHLHFEVRLNGIPVDPLEYLSQ